MTELEANLKPYCLAAVLAADRADKGCFLLDVGHDDEGTTFTSLKRVKEKVDEYLLNVYDLPAPITKLYVVGEWNLACPDKPPTETEDQQAQKDKKLRKCTAEEKEWHEAAEEVAKLIAQMPMLRELTWISGLPFVACILEKLPTSMTKLVLDLGQAIHLHQDKNSDYSHKAYITPTDMKPLVQMTALMELRFFCMRDSLQSIVWETVYGNKTESGMRVVDLQMAAEPIVRSEHWRTAQDVLGFAVVNEDNKEREYKGIDGKGILHYSFGTGEYLDDFCMRKARIASGSDEATPLPIMCLKLDGFVIDHLPFEHELSRILLLTCGDNCVDAGLRAPKTAPVIRNKWSKTVKHATPLCQIQWPNWNGTFDLLADQRDLHGNVMSEEVGRSTPVNEGPPVPTMPLTEESLHMKELVDTLDGIKDPGYFSPTICPSSTESVYNGSTGGLETLTPTRASSAPDSLLFAAHAVPIASSSVVSAASSLTLVNNLDFSSPTSIDESFEQVGPGGLDAVSTTATAGSAHEASTPTGFKHKVRRSLGWLTSSS